VTSPGYDEALRRIRAASRDRRKLLGLADLSLEEVPGEVAELGALQFLDLSGNHLTEVPPAVAGMTRLTGIDLNRNRLTGVPGWLGDLGGLVHLNLAGNRLTDLPAEAGRLSALVLLDLSYNKLTELPACIRGLNRLVELAVRGNALGELPDWICTLSGLTRLDAAHNRLARLPRALGDLGKLTALYLSHNELTELPPRLGELHGLVALEVTDNPGLMNPPPEIVAEGFSAVLDYLRALGRGAVPQWTSKMLVVGESAAGKTSVSNLLCGKPYDPAEPKTHGVHIDPLRLPHPDVPDTTMELVVWDFGGQLEYRATQRFFLSDRSLFLLVWNGRLGWRTAENRITAWLSAIASAAPTAPVVIVATHADDAVDDIDLVGVRRAFPNVVDSFPVDCKNGSGIGELRAAVTRQAADLPLMGQPWPVAWQDAALALAGTPGTHTTLSRVNQVLASAGVRDADEQTTLLAALHDRGQVLHFARVPRLSETVVLTPSWIDAMITKVLDSDDVAARGGLLGRAHRDELWPDLTEVRLAEFLTEMMEPFDLAYRLEAPGSDDVALVVERLPTSEPAAYPPEWDRIMESPGAVELRLTYKLASSQAGIPSWFIAREHRYTTHTAWARGVLLRHHNAPTDAWGLLVDDGAAQPTLRLTVRGTAPYAFYSLLDEAFTGIVRERYPGLALTRLVPCPCAAPDSTCPTEFDHTNVVSALSSGNLIQCQASFTMVDPAQLVIGLRSRPAGALALRRIEDKVDRLTRGAARAEEAQLLVLDGIRDLMHHRAEQGAHCPSIFTVTPLVPRKFRRLRRIMSPIPRYELRLYCEQPDAPHPLPDGAGTYVINGIPKWLAEYGPYLRVLLTALRHGLPVVGAILGDVLDIGSPEEIKARLEISCKVIEDLAVPEGLPTGLVNQGPSTPADFVRLRKELVRLDPEFGGLRERQLPENHGTVYLCPVHRKALHYPAAELAS
jgi:Leucine-rich repeat (LRR) protein